MFLKHLKRYTKTSGRSTVHGPAHDILNGTPYHTGEAAIENVNTIDERR